MKTVSRIILPLTLLIIFGCQSSMFDGNSTCEQPEWVERILGRTTNDSSLEGTWSYSSVVSYENTECIGEGELVDFIGSVTYGETIAVRTSNEILTFSDFEEKGYNLDEFQEMCVQKGGVLNSNGDCEFTYEEPFEYYLTDVDIVKLILMMIKMDIMMISQSLIVVQSQWKRIQLLLHLSGSLITLKNPGVR